MDERSYHTRPRPIARGVRLSVAMAIKSSSKTHRVERFIQWSRRPLQYGRSRTLASIPCASRASANDAFALDGASRPRSLLSHFPTSLKNRALRQSFQKSDKKRCSSRSPDTLESPTISRKSPGSLGFPGCALLALLRPVPPALAPSLQRSRSVPRPVVLDVQLSHSSGAAFRAGDFYPALGRWVQTDRSVL